MSRLYSVIVYLLTFLLSALFIRLAYNYEKKNKGKYLYYIFLFIAVAIPSIVAGVRDVTVGTDVKVYGLHFFRIYGIKGGEFLHSKYPSFALLAKISGIIYPNIHVFLGLIEFLIVFPIVLTLNRYREIISIERAIFYFHLLFFNYSLNIMRQSIACALMFVAIHLAKDEKYPLAVLLIIIAYGFHPMVIVYVAIMYLAELFFRLKNISEYYPNIIIISFVVLFSFFAFWKVFAGVLLNINLVRDLFYNKFITYTEFRKTGITSFMIFEGAYRLLILISVTLTCKLSHTKADKKVWEKIQYYTFLAGTIYVFSVLFIRSGVAYRITELFDLYIVLYLCLLPEVVVVSVNTGKNVMQRIISMGLIVHWLLAYIIMPGGMGFGTEIYSFSLR